MLNPSPPEFPANSGLLPHFVSAVLISGGLPAFAQSERPADSEISPYLLRVQRHSDFSNKFINLSGHAYTTLAEAKAAGAATINYGVFFNALFDFLIVAFVVFMLIRQVNRLKSEEKPSVAVTRDCPFCFSPVAIKATRCSHCTSALTAA